MTRPGGGSGSTARPGGGPEGGVDGVVVVDKEAGWTSHDVVARCRRLFAERRVGHAGTLDPDATGVLLVGMGRATRLLRFLSAMPKRYVGQVVLGEATTTLDAAGEVTGRWDMGGVALADVEMAAARLTGPILQVPPMVSAKKVGGRRLHELARAGIEVEREARPVVVHRLVVRPTGEPTIYGIDVTCSSGTYVRSLAADLGSALGGGAHLRGLRRLSVGSFTLEEAHTLEALAHDPLAHVLSPAEALRDLPSVTVDGPIAEAVGHGVVLGAAGLGDSPRAGGGPGGGGPGVSGPGPRAVLDRAGRLLAVYEEADRDPTRLKPAVVMPGPTDPRR
ncbi:MAG: tRNA pseudouridine(55) synthase TruB [Acidimicrobiales bacterium]